MLYKQQWIYEQFCSVHEMKRNVKNVKKIFQFTFLFYTHGISIFLINAIIVIEHLHVHKLFLFSPSTTKLVSDSNICNRWYKINKFRNLVKEGKISNPEIQKITKITFWRITDLWICPDFWGKLQLRYNSTIVRRNVISFE